PGFAAEIFDLTAGLTLNSGPESPDCCLMLSVCCGFSLRRPAFFIPAGWLLLLLSGCTTLTTPPAAAPAAPAAAPITSATVAAPATGAATTAARPIPAATLYSLLVAEMAGQRQRFDIAFYHYMDQARTTGDPAIAERAARIAQFVGDRKSTRLNSSHVKISYAVFCLKKKKKNKYNKTTL